MKHPIYYVGVAVLTLAIAASAIQFTSSQIGHESFWLSFLPLAASIVVLLTLYTLALTQQLKAKQSTIIN